MARQGDILVRRGRQHRVARDSHVLKGWAVTLCDIMAPMVGPAEGEQVTVCSKCRKIWAVRSELANLQRLVDKQEC